MFEIIFSEGLRDLWISTTFIFITLLLCELLRLGLHYFSKGKEGIVSKLFGEFIATGELCVCCFELCVIAENYGIRCYANYLFALTVWWSYRWGDSTGCPYTHIEEFLQGHTPFKHLILIIILQVFTGWAVYPFYVKKFWQFQYELKHGEHLQYCPADLTIPAWHGAVIEGIATCMCQLTSRVMARLNPKQGIPINAIVGTTLVVFAFEMSGGYFNPVLATSLQFNCGEVARWDHFIAYWIGPIIGSVLSLLIWYSTVLNRKLIEEPNPLKKLE